MSKLNSTDKSRLAELAKEFLARNKNVIVLNDGTIVISKNGGIIGRIMGVRKDFLGSVQEILNGIQKNKEGLSYPASLCAKAITTLVLTNERDKVIKLLYLASLIDEDPESQDIDEDEDTIVIKRPERELRVKKFSTGRSFGDTVADLLNQHPFVIFEEKIERQSG